jgi:hypothetical protein
MFERHAPYPAVATYGLDVFVDGTKHSEAERSVLPWFRGNWALGGKPLVDGAEVILHNKRFLEAARAAFGTSRVFDVTSFHGATREHYPLPFLVVMGNSGLFEAWRVVQAGAISWFYDGTGGNFDYWPEGPDGPMLSEQLPFSNVALIADNDRMYHRIGAIGDPNGELPRISASAHIQPDDDGNWAILENGKIRATYPSHAIRLSVVWKAAVRDRELSTDNLTLDRIMTIFTVDLHHRSVDFQVPSDPLADTTRIRLLQRIYSDSADSLGSHKVDSGSSPTGSG